MEQVGVKDNYRLVQNLKSAGCFIVCILLTLVCLVPLYLMIVNACRGHNAILQSPVSLIPGSNFVENMKNITTQSPQWNLLRGYRNSLIIAAGSTILTVFFSAMTAYGLNVYQFKVRDGAYTLILAVMMIPIQVTSTGFVQFMVGTLGLADSFIPLIVPAIAAPAIVFYMRQYMKSSFPLDIVEAARIDGATRGQYFWKIALPLLVPSIKSAAILSMVGSLKYFDLIYVMTGGGPGTSTELMATYMYKESFKNFNMGYGSAIAGGMFILITMVSMITMKLINGKQED